MVMMIMMMYIYVSLQK